MTRQYQREVRTIDRFERKKMKLWVLAGGLVILVALGWMAVAAAYNNGVSDGKNEQKEMVNGDLQQLGGAIEEKTQTLTKLADLNAEIPSEIDAEGIETYQEKLGEIISGVKNESVKKALEEYAGTWKELAETYASEDNSAIASALEELRSKASDAAIKITETYNNSIKDAAEKLPE